MMAALYQAYNYVYRETFMLHTMETQFGDIDGRRVADIGCGSGRLSIGSAMLGAGWVTPLNQLTVYSAVG